jgi:hypothetical protein
MTSRSVLARLRASQPVRFLGRTILILFIFAMAALPVPPMIFALLVKKDPRNNIADVGQRKKRH